MMGIIQSGSARIPVIYEDNHLLVVEKPANIPTQADISGDDDLLNLLKDYIGKKYHKPGAVYLGLVHRLDRPVGGAMVFARTTKAASRLSETFRAHQQDRRYMAVVEGDLPQPFAPVDYLIKDSSGMVRVVAADTPGAKQARLESTVIARRDGLSLIDVRLFTGRSHQIRVQHAHAGHPLWGDMRYGHGKPGRQIALWAYHLALVHPTKKEEMIFTSRPPQSGIWQRFAPDIDTWMEDTHEE